MNFFLMAAGHEEGGLPSNLRALFSVLWLGSLSGNELIDVISGQHFTITNKDFSGTVIPYNSLATLSLPDVASLKTDDDWDGLWYSDSGVVKQVPINHLVDNDYVRTLVKYSNQAPYTVEWIGLLKSDTVLTSNQIDSLHAYFQLHLYWSGVFNDSGVMKDNRGMAGVGYKGWIVKCENDLGFAGLPEATKKSINKMVLDLRNYGVYDGFDRILMFMLNDPDLIDTYSTVCLRNWDAARLTFPVPPTYENSGFQGNGTDQYSDTNFNPSTDGQNYQNNSASRIIWKFAAGSGTSYLDGQVGSANNVLTSANSTLQRINSNSNLPSGYTGMQGIGYRAINRSAQFGEGSVSLYQGITKTDFDIASVGIPNATFVILRSQFGYGNAGISFYALGRSFSEQEHGNINTAILAHKTRLGL